MKNHCNHRRVLSLLLALALCLSLIPAAYAAQDSAYHDPAEHWVRASNRTSELDSNAVVTHETFHCCICDMTTSFLVFRTPEYTRDGVSAMTRNVYYSDGANIFGDIIGRIYDGVPGLDAFYTGNHWTKAVCETCGTMNSNQGLTGYGVSKDIYILSDCAVAFMQDLDETVTYEAADGQKHTKNVKGSQYCVFCFGTKYTDQSTLEKHDMDATVTTEAANHRFKVDEVCDDCGYDVEW